MMRQAFQFYIVQLRLTKTAVSNSAGNLFQFYIVQLRQEL